MRKDITSRPASALRHGVLYGVQPLLLAIKVPDALLTMDYESAALSAAAGVAGLLLIWNIILRKRGAKYRHIASVQNERYRQFFENCPDALLVVEHEGSIVTANAPACKLLGMDLEDLLAKTFWDFVPGTSRPEFGKQFRQCISGKKMRCEGEIQASDHKVVPVELNGSLQRIGKKTLVQLYLRDNTVLKEVEEQVRLLYNQVDMAAAEVLEKDNLLIEEVRLIRKEFIAFANHRIRTPLDGIMGMAQLLADTPLNVEQYNSIQTILHSSANLLNVVRSISDTAEDFDEVPEVKAEWVNLREMCESLSKTHEASAALRGIDLRCECQSSVPVQIVTDGRLLDQVLSTLLDNAIKYTEQGLVMLNIECRAQSSDSAHLYFHVIDTGIGIAKDAQATLFEKPEQDKDTSFVRCFGGRRDLANCRRVVEQMDGRIDLTSTKGKGSTFYIELTVPLAMPEPVVDAAEPSAVSAPQLGNLEGAALVLLVDDNKISRKVVAAMLRKAGCTVDTVVNGKEALAQVRKKPYNLVLMDCQMPVMDGYEATVAIRALPEPNGSIPIIALTAHSLKHELQACRKCGMDDHLTKPVDRKVLIDTVHKYVLMNDQECVPLHKAAS